MRFGREKFDKLTFDFYTHGTYITEIYMHSVTMINIQVIVLGQIKKYVCFRLHAQKN